jgi:hypothetical protein
LLPHVKNRPIPATPGNLQSETKDR